MKIAYFAHWLEGPESGVFRKIRTQIDTWQGLGAECSLFLLTTNGAFQADAIEGINSFPSVVRSYGTIFKRFAAVSELTEEIKRWTPNVVYLRYSKYYPALEAIARELPIIAEINTDDIAESLYGSLSSRWYNRLTRAKLLGRTVGMVFVTNELASARHFARFKKPFEVIPNGITLDEYKVLPITKNEQPCLVFLGSPGQAWHGMDKLFYLARQFPNWKFEVIGPSLSDFPQKEKIPGNVALRGYLNRIKYESILAGADVGIGTLALERNKMYEACPLKVREYLAYGLPVLIGYNDSDFQQGASFLLKVPAAVPQLWDLNSIKDFVDRWRNRRVPRAEVAVLDSKLKESKRLKFLEGFVR